LDDAAAASAFDSRCAHGGQQPKLVRLDDGWTILRDYSWQLHWRHWHMVEAWCRPQSEHGDRQTKSSCHCRIVAAYEKSCDDLNRLVESIPPKTESALAHPWFGLLDAAGWAPLAGTHLAIHRAQIQKIRGRL